MHCTRCLHFIQTNTNACFTDTQCRWQIICSHSHQCCFSASIFLTRYCLHYIFMSLVRANQRHQKENVGSRFLENLGYIYAHQEDIGWGSSDSSHFGSCILWDTVVFCRWRKQRSMFISDSHCDQLVHHYGCWYCLSRRWCKKNHFSSTTLIRRLALLKHNADRRLQPEPPTLLSSASIFLAQ
jgi:hypothetical protein